MYPRPLSLLHCNAGSSSFRVSICLVYSGCRITDIRILRIANKPIWVWIPLFLIPFHSSGRRRRSAWCCGWHWAPSSQCSRGRSPRRNRPCSSARRSRSPDPSRKGEFIHWRFLSENNTFTPMICTALFIQSVGMFCYGCLLKLKGFARAIYVALNGFISYLYSVASQRSSAPSVVAFQNLIFKPCNRVGD